jgi:hypothetical protein
MCKIHVWTKIPSPAQIGRGIDLSFSAQILDSSLWSSACSLRAPTGFEPTTIPARTMAANTALTPAALRNLVFVDGESP